MMRGSFGREALLALAWLVFPLVPVLLEDSYHRIVNGFVNGGPDPRDWDGVRWLMLSGPLLGYGFLAGATIGIPDGPSRRGGRGWLARRAVWVAAGPWLGYLACAALFWILVGVNSLLTDGAKQWLNASLAAWQGSWAGVAVARAVSVMVVALLSYGWLIVAVAAVRRAGRFGGGGRAIRRGVALALGFVGSLFASFWAITEAWRGYFFDPRVVSVVLAALSLGLLCGCAATVTAGEVRRRDLFQAMLIAWVFGLALAWRWWGRPRSGPPGC